MTRTRPSLTTPQRQRLADVVTGDRTGLRLDPDNHASGRAAIPELIVEGCAYTASVRHGILAVDADPTTGDASAINDAFDELATALDSVGIATVVVASGRPGHRHLFANLGSSSRFDLGNIACWCRARGLDWRRSIRPPGTPHRSGALPVLLAPADPDAATQRLATPPPPSAGWRLAEALGLSTLSPRMRRLLRDGHASCGKRSASEGRMAVAVWATARGLGSGWVRAVLDDPANRLGETWRARSEAEKDAELARLAGKARAYVARSNRMHGADEVRSWAWALDAGSWTGQAGATDRAVAEALANIAMTRESTIFSCGRAYIGVEAGVTEKTAQRALQRLRAAGWLVIVEVHTATTSTRWRLTIPPSVTASSIGQPAWLQAGEGHDLDLGGDAARWRGGMGKTACRVWRQLEVSTTTDVAALACELGMTAASVRYHLKRLVRRDLAVRHEDGWRRASETASQYACRVNVAGARDRQRQELEARRAQRRAERRAYRTWRAQQHTAAAGVSKRCDDATGESSTDAHEGVQSAAPPEEPPPSRTSPRLHGGERSARDHGAAVDQRGEQ